jgi:hypothetical protein
MVSIGIFLGIFLSNKWPQCLVFALLMSPLCNFAEASCPELTAIENRPNVDSLAKDGARVRTLGDLTLDSVPTAIESIPLPSELAMEALSKWVIPWKELRTKVVNQLNLRELKQRPNYWREMGVSCSAFQA